jgi:hypothetical protein
MYYVHVSYVEVPCRMGHTRSDEPSEVYETTFKS